MERAMSSEWPRVAVFFSPKTKMGWLPYRSRMIGVSCLLYGVPFTWGGWPMFLMQMVCSLMSDYVMTGRDSYWHPTDRTLATLNSAFFVVNSCFVIPWWQIVLLSVGTFGSYFASVNFIKNQHFDGYRIAHTLWHVTGSASISYIMATACGPSIFSERCERKVVGLLFCNCIWSDSNSNSTLFSTITRSFTSLTPRDREL
jgi:hypothetical protein